MPTLAIFQLACTVQEVYKFEHIDAIFFYHKLQVFCPAKNEINKERQQNTFVF